MISDFDDLATSGIVDVDDDILADKLAFDKIFFNCYNTPTGKRMIDTLRERHVDVPMYNKGDTLEAVAYRQGMSDLIINIFKAIEDVQTPFKRQ